jgi:predicted nucleic acid-binding protein
MPTNADRYAVDTSVAVPALDAGHAAHDAARTTVMAHRPSLAGHAAFETFSVLTRMPGALAVDPPSAAAVITRVFPVVTWLAAEDAAELLARCGPLGIAGGSVYDALVGEAARRDGRRLLTRDHRARRTYDLLGVDHELVEVG